MIWGYHYFWKHPYMYRFVATVACCEQKNSPEVIDQLLLWLCFSANFWLCWGWAVWGWKRLGLVVFDVTISESRCDDMYIRYHASYVLHIIIWDSTCDLVLSTIVRKPFQFVDILSGNPLQLCARCQQHSAGNAVHGEGPSQHGLCREGACFILFSSYFDLWRDGPHV